MDDLLGIALSAAVPLWIMQLTDATADQRQVMAGKACDVVASQGDVLQYGGGHKFGHGAREERAHAMAGRCPGADCRCSGLPDAERDACTRCSNRSCYCHVRGEPSYSAGEVFNYLAQGLALLAYSPGGVTFAGQHWCRNHAECAAATAGRPAARPEAEWKRPLRRAVEDVRLPGDTP